MKIKLSLLLVIGAHLFAAQSFSMHQSRTSKLVAESDDNLFKKINRIDKIISTASIDALSPADRAFVDEYITTTIIESQQEKAQQRLLEGTLDFSDVFHFGSVHRKKQQAFSHILDASLVAKTREVEYIVDNISLILREDVMFAYEQRLISYRLLSLVGAFSFDEQNRFAKFFRFIVEKRRFEKGLTLTNDDDIAVCLYDNVNQKFHPRLFTGVANRSMTIDDIELFASVARNKQKSYFPYMTRGTLKRHLHDADLASSANAKASALTHVGPLYHDRKIKKFIDEQVVASLRNSVWILYYQKCISEDELRRFAALSAELQDDYFPMLVDNTFKEQSDGVISRRAHLAETKSMLLDTFGINEADFIAYEFEEPVVDDDEDDEIVVEKMSDAFAHFVYQEEGIYDPEYEILIPYAAARPEKTVVTLTKAEKKREKKRLYKQRKKERAQQPTTIQTAVVAKPALVVADVPVVASIDTTTVASVVDVPTTKHAKIKTKGTPNKPEAQQPAKKTVTVVEKNNRELVEAISELFHLNGTAKKVADVIAYNSKWQVTRHQMVLLFKKLWCKHDPSHAKGVHEKILLPKSVRFKTKSGEYIDFKNSDGGSQTLPNWDKDFKNGVDNYLKPAILASMRKVYNFYLSIKNHPQATLFDMDEDIVSFEY